jgi:hypothetical protein
MEVQVKRIKKYSYLILILIELLCILLILPGCFREEQLIYSLQGTDIPQQEQQYQGEGMRLAPGVYQVRVKCSPESEQSLYLEIDPGAHYYNSFKGNGVTIFPGEESADFEVYVTGTIPAARLQCSIENGNVSNGNFDMLTSVSIYKLNWGIRILLFWVTLVFVVFDLLLLARKRILAGQISVQQQIVFWTLFGGVLLVYFPYFTDYFSFGADTAYHLLRMEGLKETLLQGGSFPIRIHSYCNYDHGSLIPSFYGDLFLYVPVLLRLIGFPLMTAYKMFVFLVLAATAAVAYVSFKQCVQDAYAALFGSLVCLLAPYRILNLNNRGAVGEYLAMIFIPLVCCGMYLLFTRDNSPAYRKYKWWIVAGISAILHCHLLSAEMVALFMLLVCLFFWKRTFRRHTFLQLLEATVIVLLINCWFLLPMVYLLSADTYHVWTSFGVSIQSKGIEFANLLQLVPNKGSTRVGMVQSEPAFLGACMTIVVLLYPLLRIFRHRWHKAQTPDSRERLTTGSCTVFWALTLLAVAMSTVYFPWDTIEKIPVVQSFVTSLQFPTHFMGSCSVLMGLFAAFFVVWLKQQKSVPLQYTVMLTVFLSVLLVGSTLYHVNSISFDSSPARLYTAENMGTTNTWNVNFMPEECTLADFYYHQPVADEGLTYSDYEKNGTTITLNLDNTTKQLLYLEVPLTAYKGYGIRTDAADGELPYITEERGAHGDIRIAVPAHYQGTLTISYQGFALFRAAEMISLVSIGLFLSAALLKWYTGYKDKKGKQH